MTLIMIDKNLILTVVIIIAPWSFSSSSSSKKLKWNLEVGLLWNLKVATYNLVLKVFKNYFIKIKEKLSNEPVTMPRNPWRCTWINVGINIIITSICCGIMNICTICFLSISCWNVMVNVAVSSKTIMKWRSTTWQIIY